MSGNMLKYSLTFELLTFIQMRCKKSIRTVLRICFFENDISQLKSRFFPLSLVRMGMILISATMSNIIFICLFGNFEKQDFALLDWLTRILLLAVGAACLFSRLNLIDAMRSSLILRWARGKKQFNTEKA